MTPTEWFYQYTSYVNLCAAKGVQAMSLEEWLEADD